MKSLTEEQRNIFEGGEIIDSWPCDYNPLLRIMESNSAQEIVVKYDDELHVFICDWDGNPITYERSL
jgi:hypothetical protein